MMSLSSECRPRLACLIQHLTQQCGWKPQHVHLFGFSQGGTAVLDFTLHSRSVAIDGKCNLLLGPCFHEPYKLCFLTGVPA